MATDLKYNSSIGAILKAGLVELQSAASLAPSSPRGRRHGSVAVKLRRAVGNGRPASTAA